MSERVTVFISVDTEEDNWAPARRDVTVENIRRVPELEGFFQRLGVRATYFVTYQVASRPWSAGVIRDVQARGLAEIGAHLHPWNTPPTTEPMLPRLTMGNNLSYALQRAKIESLTRALQGALGRPPVSFRAGRNGLNGDTVRALIECGYRVDGSVTPTVNWGFCDDGPDFERAPLGCHRLEEGGPVPGDEPRTLFEVPNSYGYSRRPFQRWSRVHERLEARRIGPVRLLPLANRLGVVRRIVLTPELSSTRDMLRLSRCLLDEGARHLQLFLHSPTLEPGLTPYTPTRRDVDRLYASIEAYLEGLARMADIEFATMSEAESRFGDAAVADHLVRSPSTQMA